PSPAANSTGDRATPRDLGRFYPLQGAQTSKIARRRAGRRAAGLSPHAWQRTELVQHSHCSYCGTRYPDDADWPRTCPGCTETSWHNPLPVALLLFPVITGDATGLVVIPRAIELARGRLSLPGGFTVAAEPWQEEAWWGLR